MPLCLLFVLTAGDSNALDRYAKMLKGAQAVEVQFESRGFGGKLTVEPRKRFLLTVKGKGIDYQLIEGDGSIMEFDHAEREYDLFPASGLGKPPARVSGASGLLPDWVMLDDLRAMLPNKANFTEKGTETVNGRKGTKFFHRIAQEGGQWRETTVVMTEEGVPLKVHVEGVAMNSRFNDEWTIRSFKAVARPSASFYSRRVPDGYRPFALDEVYGLPAIGGGLPMNGWTGRDGRPIDLKRALPQGGLVAILGSTSEPSQRAQASIKRLRAQKLPVLLLSDAKTRDADGYDAAGKGLDTLKVSALPVFFKVNAEGRIVAIWLGFDAAKAGDFERDVLEAE